MKIDINAKLARAVTQVAFSLTLSRYQVAALACIHAKQYRDCNQGSLNALLSRGLIEEKAVPLAGLSPTDGVKTYGFYSLSYELTEAGKRVYELCQMAGLIDISVKETMEYTV